MKTTNQRRKAIAAFASGAISLLTMRTTLAASTQAQQAPSTGQVSPYDMIVPPVKSDINRIRFFFSYTCPYCRSYHNGLMQWGATIPKPLVFDAVPLITDPDDENLSIAVLGRLIGQAVAPSVLDAYDFAMYANLQGDPEAGIPPLMKLTVKDALRALVKAGANPNAIQSYLQGKGKGIENKLPEYARLISIYKINATPSVSLIGKYIVNPDHAQGNPQHFLLLLNGLVSRIIQGGSNAI